VDAEPARAAGVAWVARAAVSSASLLTGACGAAATAKGVPEGKPSIGVAQVGGPAPGRSTNDAGQRQSKHWGRGSVGRFRMTAARTGTGFSSSASSGADASLPSPNRSCPAAQG